MYPSLLNDDDDEKKNNYFYSSSPSLDFWVVVFVVVCCRGIKRLPFLRAAAAARAANSNRSNGSNILRRFCLHRRRHLYHLFIILLRSDAVIYSVEKTSHTQVLDKEKRHFTSKAHSLLHFEIYYNNKYVCHQFFFNYSVPNPSKPTRVLFSMRVRWPPTRVGVFSSILVLMTTIDDDASIRGFLP